MKQHASGFLTLVANAKKRIKEITPKELKHMIDNHEPVCLVDVREESEWALGHIQSAIHLSKGVIERDIEKMIPDTNTKIVVYCSGGFRCELVADNLQAMGYTQVFSLGTGLGGWVEEGFSLV